MNKNFRDIESSVDTIGINLNTHLNFDINKPPINLTPIMTHQSWLENTLNDNEKKL